MRILSIETSCDETAVAVVEARNKSMPCFNVLANIVSSQIKEHSKFGGVVPNLAASIHLENINICLEKALKKSKNRLSDIDLIAVTRGPGLIPALLVGVNFAKTLSYARDIPLIGVNHIEGHIYVNFIKNSRFFSITNNSQAGSGFPIIILTVSGGHTMLVLMKDHLNYKIIGKTLDDAAGEAFDKAARLLGLGYPGGPAISAHAKKFCKKITTAIKLPRPMIDRNNFDFSFSGLKTALLYKLKDDKDWKKRIPEYATEFQQAAIDVLVKKTAKAAEKYGAQYVFLTGGVAANQELRFQLRQKIEKELTINFNVPDLEYCGDNAVMIAVAGYYRYLSRELSDWRNLKADANLKL
ncbi:MAG: tRNA (adenosine(37)-N6)-threonylcarbamoyltransferase complex transferase subunit TsaD [Patescibacteria group bacterium]|nr:tRNA (adenosine(37)-N6)-threonylcarbamoyltransferase complex transferase subunit TsaD [Patescibacteria group bacterium]